MNEKIAKVQALLEDETFLEKLERCGEIREVLALFASSGAELAEEELRTLLRPALSPDAPGELDENALDQVAGGLLGRTIIPIPIKIVPMLKMLLL